MNTFKKRLTQVPWARILIIEHVQIDMVTLEELTAIHAPIERCFDLARSVEVHLAGNVHSGETAVAVGGVTSG